MSEKQSLQIEREFAEIFQRCKPFSMLDLFKAHNLYAAVRYVIEHRIPGALVECGVWRGGSAMVAAFTARDREQPNRDLYLYDTFAGMTEPTESDVRWDGQVAQPIWTAKQSSSHNEWCYASLDDVKSNLATTGYDPARIHLVAGPVEQTIPGTMPEQIALLRLDTDFYESSRHELEHLYPRLAVGGVLILDDFHYWRGQRKAVEEYFGEHGIGMMLSYVSTSAVGVKVAPVGLSNSPDENAVAAPAGVA